MTFDPSDFSYFEPTLHTYEAVDISSNSATIKAYILAGTDDIIEQGFEYWSSFGNGARTMRANRSATTDNSQYNTLFGISPSKLYEEFKELGYKISDFELEN